MVFKLNLKVNIDKARLSRVLEIKQKLVVNNIQAVIKNEALPLLIDLIMKGYDSLSDRANQGPDDPTNPALWRDEFLTKLREDLTENLIFSGNRIKVKLGDKQFLGYGPSGESDPNDSEPLHWLVFYLEGLIGDWAFLTPSDYERITRSKYKPTWGRLNSGFMVSKFDYEAQGWSRVIPFDQVRHPFSGFSPVDIFAEALNEFHIRPFIDKAIKAAVRGEKL